MRRITGISASSRILFWAAQVLGVTATILVLIWTISFRGGLGWGDKSLVFNIHPILTLVGFIVINGEGIMSLGYFPWEDEKALLIHKTSHILALILGLIGLKAAYEFNKGSNVSHLYSIHSWFGIGICGLYAFLLLQSLVVFFFPDILPVMDTKGRIQALLRCNDTDSGQSKELGRIYGFLQYLIPAESAKLEELKDPPSIRGNMRFLDPNRGYSPANNRKEQIAGIINFYKPGDPEERVHEQGRMYGISRLFDSGERLAPVNKELVIKSIDSFSGTLELTHKGLPWHTLFGLVVFVILIGTAILGFLEMIKILSSFSEMLLPKSETYLVYSIAFITFLFGLLVTFSVLRADPVTIDVTAYTQDNPPFETNDDLTTPLLSYGFH